MKLFSSPASIRKFLYQYRKSLNPQCRSLHLLQAATTHTPITPEIKDFVPLDYYTKATRIRVNIWTGKHRRVIHRLSLHHLLETRIKPGYLLVPHEPPTSHRPGYVYGTYSIQKVNPVRIIGDHAPQFTKERKSTAKDLHFESTTTPTELMEGMQDAWMWMKEGYSIEIQVHRDGKKNQLHFSKMINNCIHLRPDVLLAAMPRKSGMIIDVQTNHEKACWVMGPAYVNEEDKLEVPINQTYKFLKNREELIGLGSLEPAGENGMAVDDHPPNPPEEGVELDIRIQERELRP